MKLRWSLVLMALLLVLSACGRSAGPPGTEAAAPSEGVGEAAQPRPTPQPTEAPPPEPTPEPVLPPLYAHEVLIDEPVIVELPEDAAPEEGEKTLVYQARSEAGASVYQDVSQQRNVLAIPAAEGALGETLSLTPGVYGQVSLCAFDLRLRYDPEKLRFLGYEARDEDALVLNGDQAGVILMNYLLVQNAAEGFDLCDLEFEVLSAETCETEIGIEVVDMVALEGDDIVACAYSVVPGLLRLNPEAG